MTEIDLEKVTTDIASKYSIENNTFVNGDRLIGDIKQVDFKPRLKLTRWNNEANYSVGIIEGNETPIVETEGEIIKWKTDKLEGHFYDKPEAGE